MRNAPSPYEKEHAPRKPAWGGGAKRLALPRGLEGVTTLGEPVRVHPATGDAYVGLMVLGGVGLFLCAIGAFLAMTTGQPLSGLPVGGVGVILIALGAWNLIALQIDTRAVVVYQSGFAALVGSRVHLFRWEELASVLTNDRRRTTKRSSYTSHLCRVTKQNGETVEILSERIEDQHLLVKSIKAHVATNALPALQRAYDSGQSLTFGEVTVSRDAIAWRGRRLAWSAVSDVVVKTGRLIATPKDGSPMKVRVSHIPNVELLASLIGVEAASMELTYR